MTEIFYIGTGIGENIDGVQYIQDSIFGKRNVVYFLINDQPSTDFTQSRGDRRINFSYTLTTGDKVICHLR